jgi:hypothetical protein
MPSKIRSMAVKQGKMMRKCDAYVGKGEWA